MAPRASLLIGKKLRGERSKFVTSDTNRTRPTLRASHYEGPVQRMAVKIRGGDWITTIRDFSELRNEV